MTKRNSTPVPAALGCRPVLGMPFLGVGLRLLPGPGSQVVSSHKVLCSLQMMLQICRRLRVGFLSFPWLSVLSLFKVLSISFAISFRII